MKSLKTQVAKLRLNLTELNLILPDVDFSNSLCTGLTSACPDLASGGAAIQAEFYVQPSRKVFFLQWPL